MMEPKYGWLDALAEATHQPYYPNNTGGGPSIKVRFLSIYSFICEGTKLFFYFVVIIKFSSFCSATFLVGVC